MIAFGRIAASVFSVSTRDSPLETLDACAVIERQYTDDCAKDPCLDAGCSMDHEVCLHPLLRAGTEYHKACAVEWVKLFANHENRA